MNNPRESRPRICDYEGSNYRTEFWEGKSRDYEDNVERIALRRLLPSGGRRLLEVGAGFGRLTNEYHAYEQVVLLDYSLSQLRYAQQYLGDSDRYVYVAADAYSLPFRPGSFDGATVIRVIHHISDTSAVLRQVRFRAAGRILVENRSARRGIRHNYGIQGIRLGALRPDDAALRLKRCRSAAASELRCADLVRCD